MSISEQLQLSAESLPKAARVLRDLRGLPTYESEWGLRHPAAAYNVSLGGIAQRIISVLSALEKIVAASVYAERGKSAPDDELLEAIDHMLDALMEHFDVCNGVLKTFFHPNEKKEFEKAQKLFKRAVEPYRNHVGTIDNYLKHNQGRLRSILFRWPGGMVFGYFVEGPLGPNTLGPAKLIHPDQTGFSLNRDVAYHVCSVHAIGAQLALALHNFDRRLVPVPLPKDTEVKEGGWAAMLRKTAGLPTIFFPDEVQKAVPSVHVSSEIIHIDYPSRRKASQPPGGCMISVNMAGDGVTRTFAMPYFQDGRSPAKPILDTGTPLAPGMLGI